MAKPKKKTKPTSPSQQPKSAQALPRPTPLPLPSPARSTSSPLSLSPAGPARRPAAQDPAQPASLTRLMRRPTCQCPPPLSARAPSLTAWSHTPATPPAPRHALSLPRLAHPSAAPSPPFLPPRRETEPRDHRRGRRDPYPAAPRRDLRPASLNAQAGPPHPPQSVAPTLAAALSLLGAEHRRDPRR